MADPDRRGQHSAAMLEQKRQVGGQRRSEREKLVGQDVAGWIVGLAVGVTSATLAALLWSSRRL
jgi:hypothetical protein